MGRHRVHFKLLPDCQCTSEPGAPWRVSTSLVCVCILVTAAVRGLVTINPNWSQEHGEYNCKGGSVEKRDAFRHPARAPFARDSPPGHHKQNLGQLVATKQAAPFRSFEPSWSTIFLVEARVKGRRLTLTILESRSIDACQNTPWSFFMVESTSRIIATASPRGLGACSRFMSAGVQLKVRRR